MASRLWVNRRWATIWAMGSKLQFESAACQWTATKKRSPGFAPYIGADRAVVDAVNRRSEATAIQFFAVRLASADRVVVIPGRSRLSRSSLRSVSRPSCTSRDSSPSFDGFRGYSPDQSQARPHATHASPDWGSDVQGNHRARSQSRREWACSAAFCRSGSQDTGDRRFDLFSPLE